MQPVLEVYEVVMLIRETTRVYAARGEVCNEVELCSSNRPANSRSVSLYRT